jgi:hypothetical protein
VEIKHPLTSSSKFCPLLVIFNALLTPVSTNETAKKCEIGCSGDNTQACGGDGTYASIYYDRMKYVPGPDSILGLPGPGSDPSSTVSSRLLCAFTCVLFGDLFDIVVNVEQLEPNLIHIYTRNFDGIKHQSQHNG